MAAADLAPRLVDHDPGVGQRVPLARRARRQQNGGRGRGQADAQRPDVGPDVLHGVVDRQAGGRLAARGVDVELDVALGILRLEEQELRGDEIGDGGVDRRSEEDDAVPEQPRVDVVRALAARRLLHDVRNQAHGRLWLV